MQTCKQTNISNLCTNTTKIPLKFFQSFRKVVLFWTEAISNLPDSGHLYPPARKLLWRLEHQVRLSFRCRIRDTIMLVAETRLRLCAEVLTSSSRFFIVTFTSSSQAVISIRNNNYHFQSMNNTFALIASVAATVCFVSVYGEEEQKLSWKEDDGLEVHFNVCKLVQSYQFIIFRFLK